MPTIINWKHIWKQFTLSFEDKLLLDNKKSLRDYGISNRSELTFSLNILRKN